MYFLWCGSTARVNLGRHYAGQLCCFVICLLCRRKLKIVVHRGNQQRLEMWMGVSVIVFTASSKHDTFFVNNLIDLKH